VQRPAEFLSTKLSLKKGTCAVFLVLCVYSLILITIFVLIYLISSSFLNGTLTEILNDSYLYINNFFTSILNSLPSSIKNVLIESASGLIRTITNFAGELATGMPMFLTGSIVTILASCYIAKDFDGFKDGFLESLDEKYLKLIDKLTYILKNNFLKIIVGYLKLMLITFAELLSGLILLKVNNAFLLAALISILDLLPIIGTGTILIPWCIYNILTDNVFLGVGLLTLYGVIAIVRNVLEPRIIGKQIGLHPLIAVLTVFAGLKFGGFIGMITAPLTVMLLYQFYKEKLINFTNKQ
jgi:sporulation integral membrane protein YtvI